MWYTRFWYSHCRTNYFIYMTYIWLQWTNDGNLWHKNLDYSTFWLKIFKFSDLNSHIKYDTKKANINIPDSISKTMQMFMFCFVLWWNMPILSLMGSNLIFKSKNSNKEIFIHGCKFSAIMTVFFVFISRYSNIFF